jgi:hypothetical protein
VLVALLCLLAPGRHAWGYVEATFALGKVVAESTNVLLITVEKVDKQKNLIVYRKVQDIKGVNPGDTIKHNIGQFGFHPREWQNIMAWAEVGKVAVFFHNRSAGEVCIDNYWYQAYAGDWWQMTHAEPYLLRTFAGRPEKLAAFVTAMLAGQEVVVPCMADGDKNALHLRNGKMQRMRASMKREDYNPGRDFVDFGAGADEFRAIAGMPGFTHYAGLSRVGPGAAGVAAASFAGNGKAGVCLFGASRLALLQNSGGSFDDLHLPVQGGARAAAWADYDGDGKLDLLLATPAGPKLFRNNGKQFEDVSAVLPHQDYYNVTAAAWIDYDGDGKPDILLADGFRGLRLYRNKGASPEPPGPPRIGKWFDDVSDKAGLGPDGAGGRFKGDRLAVADVNNDGQPDVLYSAGNGVLVLNTPQGFVEAKDSGISYQAGGVTPVFGDFNGDGRPDLFVPQRGACKLYRNDGNGHFTDVTAQAGDLARPVGDARCAAWVDFLKGKRPDLFVGCLKGPNRYFRNNGNGAFTDATEEIGLGYRIFNTCALAAVDLNNDGVPDLVFNNEGQESVVLLTNPDCSVVGGVAKVAAAGEGSPAARTTAATPAAPTADRTAVPSEDRTAAPARSSAPAQPAEVDSQAKEPSPWWSASGGISVGIVLVVILVSVVCHIALSRRP